MLVCWVQADCTDLPQTQAHLGFKLSTPDSRTYGRINTVGSGGWWWGVTELLPKIGLCPCLHMINSLVSCLDHTHDSGQWSCLFRCQALLLWMCHGSARSVSAMPTPSSPMHCRHCWNTSISRVGPTSFRTHVRGLGVHMRHWRSTLSLW